MSGQSEGSKEVTRHSVTVRPARREDAPVISRLVIALADYEKLDPPDEAAQKRLIEDAFRRPYFVGWRLTRMRLRIIHPDVKVLKSRQRQ